MTMERLRASLADRYRIERELGAGGMATVYLAEDLKHHRKVAVKVLRPELAAALGPERFLREIETTANLRHPHILPLYDSGIIPSLGDPQGRPFYVMPFVEGESLRDRLTREKQLPLDDALQIAREVADALSYAHARGIVHRDIKPENILLESGHAAVADFGIARAIDAAATAKLTETGLAIGTPAYMSPEQATGDAVDGRSDLYALACVLYEMLAGEAPHHGPTPQAVIARRLSYPATPLHELRPSVPTEVERALDRALALLPADRFPTISQFEAALQSRPAGPAWVASGPWRVLSLYLLAAASLLGAVHLIGSQLELPNWVLIGFGLLLVAGFPLALTSVLVQRGSLRPPPRLATLFAGRRTLLGGVLALATWAIAVTVYLLAGGGSGASAPPGSVTVAVLPFEVSGLDSTIWRWGGANLVSANLDGVGALRRIDPRTLESRWRLRAGPGSPRLTRTGIEVGRELGARYALTATMVNAGGRLRLSADLYQTGSGDHAGPSVQVEGSADSIPDLLDRLSIEVLRRTPLVTDVARLPQIDLARVISASPEAVKAYLAGEELYRRSRWEEAIGQFNRAVEVDSAFARAWYRLALAHGWLEHPIEQLEYARRAERHSARLPERERQLLLGLEELAGGSTQSVGTLEEYTRRYPEDVEGWTLLGQAAYAYNGLRLDPLDRFRSAYSRAIELSPFFGPAYIHLLLDGFQRVDSALVRRLLVGYRNIDSQSNFCVGFELANSLAFGDSAQHRWAVGAMDTLGAGPGEPVQCAAYNLVSSPQYHEPLHLVIQSLRRPARPAEAHSFGEWMEEADLLQHGRIREARRILKAKMDSGDDPIYALAMLGMLNVTHSADSDAARLIERVGRSSSHPQAPFWYGMLAAVDGRQAALRQAVAELEQRAAAGDSLQASGNRAAGRALELYAELRRAPDAKTARQIIDLLPRFGWGAPNAFRARLLRYELGRALLGLGAPGEARRLFESFSPNDLGGEYVTIVEYYRGRVAEDLGLPEARLHYQRFIRWWEQADPELQPWRQDARERLARLTSEP
ncbi:MAG: protein kinase domain-containing protein [Gemmatimonadales bacterium]